ncbi:MAG: hypothetical protein ACR2PA_25600 [Hyphomicrobiaceae bacterium]
MVFPFALVAIEKVRLHQINPGIALHGGDHLGNGSAVRNTIPLDARLQQFIGLTAQMDQTVLLCDYQRDIRVLREIEEYNNLIRLLRWQVGGPNRWRPVAGRPRG